MAQSAWIRKLGWTFGVAVAVCIAAYVAWNAAYPSGNWRYKLTVAVETPEGIKTGSAVREVRAERFRSFFTSSPMAVAMTRGEAVVIDLGARGVLFALNSTVRNGIDGAHNIVSSTFPAPQFADPKTYIRYYTTLQTGATEVDPDNYPVLVRFRDPADPKTVEAVKPDGFAEAFGEGVKLKSVTIEITREPVTRGVVEGYLSWMEGRAKLPGAIGGDPETPFQDPTKTWLTPGDFRTRK